MYFYRFFSKMYIPRSSRRKREISLQVNIYQRFKAKIFLSICILAIVILLLFLTSPVLAQDREILLRTSQNMTNIEAWWDRLWESTFNPPPLSVSTDGISDTTGLENSTNLSMYAFVNPVRFFIAIGVVCWIAHFGWKMSESREIAGSIHTFLLLFFPIFVAVIFLSDQALYSRVLAYGLRDISNTWSNGVMNLTIADFNVRSAIQDMLVTEDAKEIIVQKWETCQAMPQPEVVIPSIYRPGRVGNTALPPPGAENPPTNGGNNTLPPPPPISETEALPITLEQRQVYDYLECLQELSYFAETKLNEADNERRCGNLICKTFKTLYKVFYNIGTVTYEQELSDRLSDDTLNDSETINELDRIRARQLDPDAADNVDVQIEDLAMDSEQFVANLTNPSKPLLYFSQWMWISILELAMFLNGLFAPIFIAISTIPGKQNMFAFWLIENLTIALGKLAYIVIIAVVAVQLTDPTNFNLALDNTFFMTLGIFAPAVSFAVVTAGGIAAATSFSGQSVGAAAIAGSAMSGVAATVTYSLARSFDKRR